MINPAELDTRLLSHTARVDAADRFGALLPPVSRRTHNGLGGFVLRLHRLTDWIGREHVGQSRNGGVAA